MGYPVPQTSSKATTSLVLGILGLVVCGLLGIAAIIIGRQAQAEIAQSQGALTGEGLAKAGIILGWVEVAIVVVGLLFLILFLAVAAVSAA
jgi:hypothetical protein